MTYRKAHVNSMNCVACGCCVKVCPRDAISIWHGCYAEINQELCVGCGKCETICPACIITLSEKTNKVIISSPF